MLRKTRSADKLWNLLLCLSLVISLFAGMTMAAGAADHVKVTMDLDFTADSAQCSTYAPGNDSDSGITWYPDGATIDGVRYEGPVLALDGADIDCGEDVAACAVTLPAGTTVVTTADSSITNAGIQTDEFHYYDCVGIYGNGALTFAGPGTLTVTVGKSVTGDSCGISAQGTLTNSGSLIAAAGTANRHSYGVYAADSIYNTGTLKGTGDTAWIASYGIYTAQNLVNDTENAVLVGNAGETVDDLSAGIYAGCCITNNAGAEMTGTGGKADKYCSFGICCGDQVVADTVENQIVNSGTMTGYGKGGNISSAGIRADDGIINKAGAEMTGTGEESYEGESCGIQAQDIINSGTMQGSSGAAYFVSYGIYVDNSLTNNAGAELTGIGGKAAVSFSSGICGYGEDCDVTNYGTMTGTAGEGAGFSYGIYADGDLQNADGKAVMTGNGGKADSKASVGIYSEKGSIANSGTMQGNANQAEMFSEGICAKETINNQGTLEAIGGAGTLASYGISGGVDCRAGTITAKAGAGKYSYGIIFESNDSLTVSEGATVNVTAGAGTVYCRGIYAGGSMTVDGTLNLFCTGGTGALQAMYLDGEGKLVIHAGGLITADAAVTAISADQLSDATDRCYTVTGGTEEKLNGTQTKVAPASKDTRMEIFLKLSQDAPEGVEATDETARGKNDGTITGVKDTMEYKLSTASDDAYIPVPKDASVIEKLQPGTYDVRFARHGNYQPSEAVTVTIQPGPFIVTFDARGGSTVDPVRTQGTLTEIPTTTRNGYTFLQWNTEPDGSGTALTRDTAITAHVTYYAIWQPNLTVTFEEQGGTAVEDLRNITPGETLEEAGKTIPVTTRNGYSFLQWNTAADGTGTTLTEDTEITEDVTFYAVWVYNYKTFVVSVPKTTEHGTVTADRTEAGYNQPVTLTVTPDEGYEVAAVTVTDPVGQTVPVTDNGDGTYTFQMPAGDVTVKVTFKAAGSDKPDEPDEPDEPEEPDFSTCPRDDTCVYAKYTDADPQAWYHDGVHYCVQNGLMNGVSGTEFAPNQNLSRAMLVTILYRLEGEPAFMNSNIFSDVEAGARYEKAVVWANSQGIVEGYGDGTFGPEDNVTREQLAVILYRYAKFKGIDTAAAEDTNILSYDDAADVSAWAVTAMQWACGSGIINGSDGCLVPQGDATRAEAAAMMQRFCENVLKLPADTDLSVRW